MRTAGIYEWGGRQPVTDDLAEKVLAIVARETQRERKDLNLSDRIEDLSIQSLDMVQIMFGIEEEFDIYVPQEDESFGQKTLQDMVDGIARLIAETVSEPAQTA